MFYLFVNKYNLIVGCPLDALDEPNTQVAHHKNVFPNIYLIIHSHMLVTLFAIWVLLDVCY